MTKSSLTYRILKLLAHSSRLAAVHFLPRAQSRGPLVALCFLLFALSSNAQTQKGADIDGEAAGDLSGHSVSMPDANTLAIGAYLNDGNGSNAGHVRIYTWNGSAWTQKGTDIDGEAAGDQLGYSVNMPDANTVAIGAHENDGNGNNSGHVRIYKWNGSNWAQKGADIDGEAANDLSGWSVSMPDSNTLAIGARLNDGNGSSAGHVRVYDWNGSAWVQKGADLDGEAAGDQSGWSVSMPDANTLAIGATNNRGNGFFAGHVRIYSWNGSAWIQKGADIDGEAAFDISGFSVSMPDANTLAIGATGNAGNGSNAGHVRIYTWSGSAWVQKGADIDGEAADDESGISVSMPDANTLAIGANQNDGNGSDAGHVRIYSWNGSAWTQKGADLDGEAAADDSGYSVSMPDANTLAIGAPNNDGNGSGAGHVRVYTLCAPTTGTDVQTACNSYTWIDGNTYTSSNNTAKDTLVNAAGCDSIVTLNLTINSSNTQTQKGADLDGEAAFDQSGTSVSMPDANTLAIGAWGNDGNGSAAGHVRVYSWNGSAWVQIGADLDGEAAFDQSGYSVSMPDANTLAIGAPFNDGNGSSAGHVRIYSWNGSAWIQKGADLEGEAAGDESGYSVSMPDANTLAIGAPDNDGNGSDAGHVRIYTWNGSAWVQKGADLDGEASGDLSGNSVSMPDANTIAIGAIGNAGNGSNAGHVRIYSWNGSSWTQKGADIDGEAVDDYSGWSVSMPDFNTVAIGATTNDGNGSAAGHVRIYSWNGSAWVQKGADIDGEAASDESGNSVSMPDANTVAIGAPRNDGNGSSAGHVRIFSWNGSAWVQIGVDLDGEAVNDQSGWSVSMPDVNTLAIGARGNGGNGFSAGHVRVYTLCSCTETNAALSVLACNNYTAPSGAVFSTSGTFQDTIANLVGCDSVITINLDLNPPATVTWTGAVDSLWHSPCNWSNYQVPLCCQTANIPNTTIKPYINDTALAESLLVDSDNGGRTFINPTGKLFINDCTHEATVDTGNYVIGSAGPACGIVFYDKGSYSNGWRYLEAMPFDQNGGAGISWGPNTFNGATSLNIGDGLSNTTTIVAGYGAGSYAAQVANDLTFNGFSDWFLPTENELQLVYNNLFQNGVGNFSTTIPYWTSSENGASGANHIPFVTGTFNSITNKSNTYLVRAIRRF